MAVGSLDLATGRVQAQSGGWQSIYATNTNVSLIPPSPNAASFQKYGLTPVSFNTGVPNISIPVYEVKTGDLSMPITLSYHYNGLKPKEEASWAGLGWNLNVGGCITRMKRGAIDGTRPAGRNYDDINPYALATNTTNSDPVNNPYPYQIFLFNTFFTQYYDTEPDIYIFNFFGHQGKFLFINNKPRFIEYERWKVTKFSDDGGFFITDENGTQYLFTTIERTQAKVPSKEDPFNPSGWISCWQLTRVISADQKHWINFYYASYTYSELNTVASQTYRIGYGERALNNTSTCSPVEPSTQLNTNTPVGNNIYGQSLSSITTSELQTIAFKQSPAARKDIGSDQNALKQVVVYGQTGHPDTVVRRLAFQYGYFGDSTSPVYARLKLSGLYELSATGDTLNNYSFEYQNEFAGFPAKTTVSVDQWGYCNKPGYLVGEASLVPNTSFPTYSLGTKQTTIFPVPNGVDPDVSYAQYGLISKIHYPTGGYSSYAFEQNRYSYLNNTALSSSGTVDTTFFNQLFYSLHAPQIDSTSGAFVVNNTTTAYITNSRTLWDSLSLPYHNFKPIVVLKRINNFPTCGNDLLIPPVACTFDIVYSSPQLYTDNSYTDSITLVPGHYLYTVYCESASFNVVAGFKFSVVHPVYYTNTGSPAAPGLRIASITDYTDTTTSQSSLQRSYIYTDSTGRCSGNLRQLPQYQSFVTEESSCPNLVYNISSDNNGIYNASLQFGFNYSGVREYTAPAQSNTYFSEHYYDPILILSQYITQDIYAGETADPGQLPGDQAVIENLVLTDPVEVLTVDWNNTSSGYKKVKSISSAFNMVEDTSFVGVRPISLTDATLTTTDIKRTAWSFDAYTLHCLWRYPVYKRETDYDTTGNSYTVTTNYTFDKFKRELRRTDETINNGKTIVTKYKYPDDYEDWTAGGQTTDNIYHMSLANVLTPTVETQIWQKTASDSSVIKGVVDDYDTVTFKPSKKYFLFVSSPLHSLDNELMADPPLFSTLISDSRYREKIRFRYDRMGNTIETALDSNMNVPTSYVWAYHYLYPVAKIVGARFSTVLTKIDSAAIQGITNDSLLRMALAPLRTISGAQTTIYTYTPFVGITSETDMNGRTTYYEYDKFKRVTDIRDFNHNILKNFFYYFAPPPVAPPPPPPPTLATITSTNFIGVTGFTAVYTNTTTSQQYSFTIPAAGGTLGTIPIATYNLVISKPGNSTQYGFYVNCGSLGTIGTSASFSNLSISPTSCTNVTLDSND